MDDARKVNYHKKLNDKKEKENQAKRKGHTLVHAEKEMDELVKIKKDLMGQSNYLRKFKKLNNEINRHLVKAKPEPQIRFGSVDRRSLVDRQRLAKVGHKSRASLSPE